MAAALDSAAPSRMLRVLIVEDDQESLALMAELLRASSGHAVTMATTGEDGLRCCRGEAYDLVVADIGLPEMSGLDMLDRIWHEGLLAETAVVVVCSAYDRQQKSAERRGARFLSKPVDIGKLRELVEHTASRPPTFLSFKAGAG